MSSPAAPEPPPGYSLVFSDDFDSGQLNRRHWRVEEDGRGGGNYESQYYTADAVTVHPTSSPPHLRLTAQPIVQPDGSNASDLSHFLSWDIGAPNPHQPYQSQRYYTSGKVTSRGLFSFQYGRVDVRAQLPAGSHTWPAAWLLPVRQDGSTPATTWPNLGKIDIVELIGKDRQRNGGNTTVIGSVNYGTSYKDHRYRSAPYRLPEGEFSDGFHVFSVLWEPSRLTWMVDGEVYHTLTPADLHIEWPFGTKSGEELCREEGKAEQSRFYAILNLAIGGNLGGLDVPPLDQLETNGRNYEAIDVKAHSYTSRKAQHLLVDYVRVYQPSAGAPIQWEE